MSLLGNSDRAEIAVGHIAIWNVRRDSEVQGRSNLGGARDNRIAANMPAVVACDHQDVRFLAVDARIASVRRRDPLNAGGL